MANRLNGVSSRSLDRFSWAIALAVALATLFVGIRWGTFAAGGSDSYCYVSQAIAWAEGRISAPQHVGFTATWPDSAETFVPVGYIASPATPGAIAPTCPAGLALLMALFWKVGGLNAIFLVVPLLGALSVWLAFLLGRALGRPLTGAVAAILIATSPIVLYQVVQPMSDVPATAWWLLVLVALARPGRVRTVGGGLAASLAIVTRPNLAPLAIAAAVFLAFRPSVASSIRARAAAVGAFVLGVVPGAVLVAWIQRALYGSPFSSGYGAADKLFSLSYLAVNIQRYPRWVFETEGVVAVLAIAAPLLLHLRARRRGTDDARDQAWLGWLAVTFVVLVSFSYLLYLPFDAWWFIRFLLPAIALLAVFAAIVMVGTMDLLPARVRGPLLIGCAVVLAALRVSTASTRFAFDLAAAERHFVDAGDFVNRRLPAGAVVLTAWESGSVRIYGHRLTITVGAMDPDWLDRAVGLLETEGRHPYLLFERSEEDAFRQRFGSHSRFGQLDWPPIAEIDRKVRVYDPADRARYFAGETVNTERLWPAWQRGSRGGAK